MKTPPGFSRRRLTRHSKAWIKWMQNHLVIRNSGCALKGAGVCCTDTETMPVPAAGVNRPALQVDGKGHSGKEGAHTPAASAWPNRGNLRREAGRGWARHQRDTGNTEAPGRVPVRRVGQMKAPPGQARRRLTGHSTHGSNRWKIVNQATQRVIQTASSKNRRNLRRHLNNARTSRRCETPALQIAGRHHMGNSGPPVCLLSFPLRGRGGRRRRETPSAGFQ
jgi:hypothetical protein